MRVGNNYTGARWAFSQRSRPRYSIDWEDPHYPEILRDSAGDLTLAEAKRQLVAYFQSERDHARSMLAQVRALRAKDVNER